MSIVNGNLVIECNRCNTNHAISAEETDFEDRYGGERQMGPENGYAWESIIECDCGNTIEINYEVWEYPIGAFNNDTVEITGGKEISRFDYDFHGDPNSYNL